MTVIILAAAALAGAMTEFLPTRFVVLAGVSPVAAWAGAAQLAFAQNVWLPLVAPMVALATSAVTVLLFRYWVVDRDGRRIRTAFRQYLAPELVAELAAHPERLQLAGEMRLMTILFCDLRSSTTLAEGMDARALTSFLNSFLSPMTEIIPGPRVDRRCVRINDVGHALDPRHWRIAKGLGETVAAAGE